MSNPRRWLAKWIVLQLGIAAAVALVLGAELIVRITMPRLNPLRSFVKAPTVEMIVDAGTPTMTYDAELSHRLLPNLRAAEWAWTRFDTNAQGLRRAADISAKEPGTIRIACFGDSCTFGFGVPWIFGDKTDPAEKPYADLLEASLSSAFPGKKIEVLNMGVPGYTSTNGLVAIRRALAEFRPDIVTAAFLTNDIVDPGLSARQVAPHGLWQKCLRNLAGSSQLVLHTLDAVRRHTGPKKITGYGVACTPLETYIRNHEAMRKLCAAAGAEFVIINPFFRDVRGGESRLPPTRVKQYRECLRTYVAAANVPWVDVPEVTEAHQADNDALFMEAVHPNAKGHRIIAERLHTFLLPTIGKR